MLCTERRKWNKGGAPASKPHQELLHQALQAPFRGRLKQACNMGVCTCTFEAHYIMTTFLCPSPARSCSTAEQVLALENCSRTSVQGVNMPRLAGRSAYRARPCASPRLLTLDTVRMRALPDRGNSMK